MSGGNDHGNGHATGTGVNGSLADQAVSAALRYRSQAPLLDSLLQEVGIDGGSLDGLTAAVRPASHGEPPVSAAETSDEVAPY